MSHCVPHKPIEHTWPFPHPAPLGSLVQVIVAALGVHSWQALFGF
jgi:hypothetical protein